MDSREKQCQTPVFKEQERIMEKLKAMKEGGKIDEKTYNRLWPTGSQPARLYGLAKVHKDVVPLRPVLSMPGSVYHPIAEQVTEWLNVVPQCQINTSTQKIADKLATIKLEENEEIISFDIVSLYTNVPVEEAIEVCTDLLYSGEHQLPPVDKETFKELLKLCTCNVLMQTHDGFYRQTDGLAMGSPPAPLLANGWLSTFDPRIKEDAKLYDRYMDDILMEIHTAKVEEKLGSINTLNPSLKFTMERETEKALPFLAMKIIREGRVLSSTWYNKPTDTGLVMNYHALAPKRYKRSVVSGFVYRIHHACSTWKHFSDSLEKAKRILELNQYPPEFYEPLIEQALTKIIEGEKKTEQTTEPEEKTIGPEEAPEEQIPKKLVFLEYRGKVTDDFCRELAKVNAPCQPVLTLRKLKTVLPSLKSAIEKRVRSNLVYRITCPRCRSCYIGYTTQYSEVRFRKHRTPSQPVGKHLRECGALRECTMEEHWEILASSTRGEQYLMTLEALWQKEERPTINTKQEYKSRELTIMW